LFLLLLAVVSTAADDSVAPAVTAVGVVVDIVDIVVVEAVVVSLLSFARNFNASSGGGSEGRANDNRSKDDSLSSRTDLMPVTDPVALALTIPEGPPVESDESLPCLIGCFPLAETGGGKRAIRRLGIIVALVVMLGGWTFPPSGFAWARDTAITDRAAGAAG
jgi:hypothetical protein